MTPIKTDKHEIVSSNLSINLASGLIVDLVKGVSVGSKSSSTECAVGSHVRAIYCEFNVAAEDVANANIIHWQIQVKRTNQTITNPTFYYQTDRSQIIKRGMEMLPKDVSTVYKRVFLVRIPKAYQRVKDDSEIQIEFRGSSSSLVNLCGFFIYKEIY